MSILRHIKVYMIIIINQLKCLCNIHRPILNFVSFYVEHFAWNLWTFSKCAQRWHVRIVSLVYIRWQWSLKQRNKQWSVRLKLSEITESEFSPFSAPCFRLQFPYLLNHLFYSLSCLRYPRFLCVSALTYFILSGLQCVACVQHCSSRRDCSTAVGERRSDHEWAILVDQPQHDAETHWHHVGRHVVNVPSTAWSVCDSLASKQQ